MLELFLSLYSQEKTSCNATPDYTMKAMARIFLAIAASAMWIMVATAATTSNCDSGLRPCFSYVAGANTKPPTECCQELSSLKTNSSRCLCQLIMRLNYSSEASHPVFNRTKAFNLPKEYNITLNTSDCHALVTLPAATSTSPSPAVPTTSSPDKGSTATNPVESLIPGNNVHRLLPACLKAVGVVAAAALVTLQGLW